MWIQAKSAIRLRSCFPTRAPPSPARPFTSIVATTSWVSEEVDSRPFTVNESMSKLTITIDGPAGSGKSSVARRVAALLGYSYLDSGAMYRALALKALERKVALDDQARIEALAKETHIALKPPTPDLEAAGAKNRVLLDGKEVTREIRTSEVAQADSQLATVAAVRRVLVAQQQRAVHVHDARHFCTASESGFFLYLIYIDWAVCTWSELGASTNFCW